MDGEVEDASARSTASSRQEYWLIVGTGNCSKEGGANKLVGTGTTLELTNLNASFLNIYAVCYIWGGERRI